MALSNTTTADAIRDRALDVIEAVSPEYVPGSRFRRYRNEGDGDFLTWAESNPEAAFRRFQVRFTGNEQTPTVSNADHEERAATLITIVAYPHNARTGAKQALDRDTAIDRDYDQLWRAIGLYSRSNFSAPFPDACWIDGDCQRTAGEACDFLILTTQYLYRRTVG